MPESGGEGEWLDESFAAGPTGRQFTLGWEGAQEGGFQEKTKLVSSPTRFVLEKKYIVRPF